MISTVETGYCDNHLVTKIVYCDHFALQIFCPDTKRAHHLVTIVRYCDYFALFPRQLQYQFSTVLSTAKSNQGLKQNCHNILFCHIYCTTPSIVYNGHLKFQTSVSLRIPLYGSLDLSYIACKMDYMWTLQPVRYKPYWVYVATCCI